MANPALESVFVVWDTPAMGTVHAARRLGREIAVTTVDLGEQVAIELAAGGMIKGLDASHGRRGSCAARRSHGTILLGKEAPPYVALPALPVTRANVLAAWESVYPKPPPPELVEAAS